MAVGSTSTPSILFSRLRGVKVSASLAPLAGVFPLRTLELRLVLLDWRLGVPDEVEVDEDESSPEVDPTCVDEDLRARGARTGITMFWVYSEEREKTGAWPTVSQCCSGASIDCGLAFGWLAADSLAKGTRGGRREDAVLGLVS